MNDITGSALVIILGVIALVGVILVAGTIFVIVKYRPPTKGIAAALAGLAYVLSPVDAVPEIAFGPVGLVDDIAVAVAAITYVRGLLKAREVRKNEPD